MPLLTELRHSPWFTGALLLLLAAGLALPLAVTLGPGRWPFYAGLVAILLLLFGAVERLWKRRPARRSRTADRSRFRVVTGGKGKGNGHADDVSSSHEDSDGDKPRWVM